MSVPGQQILPVGLQNKPGYIDDEYAKVDHVHSIETALLDFLTNSTDTNMIDNPEFKHSQRGVPVTGTNQFVFDRWWLGASGTAVASHAFSGSTPSTDIQTSGLYTITTADATIGASDFLSLQHAIEGYDFAKACFGTTSAKPVTLSFWVRATLAGTYTVSLRNGGLLRYYIREYVLAANTWTKIVLTFPGCTDGTWDTTTAVGAYLNWGLATGSTFQGTANTWGSGANAFGTSNQVNLAATIGNFFQITQVQLTVGTYDPPFKQKNHIDDLNKCRRYFHRSTGLARPILVRYLLPFAASYSSMHPYIVPMRDTPVARFGRFAMGDNNVFAVNGAGAVVDPLAGVTVQPLSFTHFRLFVAGDYIYLDPAAGLEFSSEI